jgi:pimeloyl-ACP methyl ester carboxylesterase
MESRHLMSLHVSRTEWALLAGAVAGAAIVANYLVARRTEARHPPTGAFIEVDGVRLHYIERGSGPPVVLLHGNGAMADDFAVSGVLDQLARDHRVIAFDRPGFGYSARPRGTVWTASAQAELLHEALRRMGVRDPVVVGHSWGTLVTLAMALDHPLDIAAIVLLSGFYIPRPRADVLLTSWPAIPVLGDALRYTILPLLGWMMARPVFRKLFAPAPVSRSFRDRFPTAMALRPSQLRATAADTALMIPAAASLRPRYNELTMPVVIVAGAGDKIVTTERQSAQLHANVPHSDFRRIPAAGHMIHHIAPDQVTAAIRAAARPMASGAA